MNINADRQHFSPDEDPIHDALQGDDAQRFIEQLLNDPDTEIAPPDQNGNQAVFYKDRIIGMLNPLLGVGAIDPDAYAELSGMDSEMEIDDDPDVSDSIMSATEAVSPKDDLVSQLKKVLTDDMCLDIVNLAYSEHNEFARDVFLEADEFFNASLGNEDPQDIATKFFDGEDLDDGGAANPDREYFRFNSKENIESTDEPGAIYYDELLDDIIDYIIDHMSEIEFDEEIQTILDSYLNYDEER